MAQQQQFDPAVLTKGAEDTFTVRRVFGEAYQREGVLVVPVARVSGFVGAGAGGGEGHGPWASRFGHRVPDEPAAPDGPDEQGPVDAGGGGSGGGGGYGVHVKPLGVYVVDANGAHWQPTVDVNLVILGAQLTFTVVASVWALAGAIRRR
jgi:uncharacterized spore protein YtfJ